MLATYGELAVKIALNLQPHQRLLIVGPIANGGASLDAAPLVRKITESAYRAGARYVETLWGDEPLQLLRYRHAPRDSFEEFSAWLPDALLKHAEAGQVWSDLRQRS
jgi:aminopeptidase